MKSITAYHILALLAMASSVLAVPVNNIERGITDADKALKHGTSVVKASALVVEQDLYADTMRGAKGTPGHKPNGLSKNPIAKVTINTRTDEHIRDLEDGRTKRSPQDDDSYEDSDADDDNDDDWQKRYTPESLVKVHVLADHTTSGKDGVINAGTDQGQNLHLVQTPGKDENVAHLRVSPPASANKGNLYVNVPSDTDGHKIPPGGVAKNAAKTENKAKLAANKAPGASGTEKTAEQAVKVVDLEPIAEAYVDGPFLNGRDEAMAERTISAKTNVVIGDIKGAPKKAGSKGKNAVKNAKNDALKVNANVKIGRRATSAKTLKLPSGSLPKSVVPCPRSHKKDDLVDVCIDARLLSVAPKGSGACPRKDNHEIDLDALVKGGGLVRLCVDAGAA